MSPCEWVRRKTFKKIYTEDHTSVPLCRLTRSSLAHMVLSSIHSNAGELNIFRSKRGQGWDL